MEGEAALSRFPRENSKGCIQRDRKVVRVYRPWKSKGRVQRHWEQYVRAQVREVEEAMVLELSLPKPGGHVLSP
jgi:hypothetical protein